jgi:hypothetical protein
MTFNENVGGENVEITSSDVLFAVLSWKEWKESTEATRNLAGICLQSP